jgi:hypothetical protein
MRRWARRDPPEAKTGVRAEMDRAVESGAERTNIMETSRRATFPNLHGIKTNTLVRGRWTAALRLARNVFLAAAIAGAPLPALAAKTSPSLPKPVPAGVQWLSPTELDDVVAPVALYPDPLLSQVLVASTYPLEVVEAHQWLLQHGKLKGHELVNAARRQSWDASVQALVAFPDVLDTLSEDVSWTTELGNAFLAQEQDVMAAVQWMRAQAEANGRLSSTAQQKVATTTNGAESAVEIVPANPDVIYVPRYDPAFIWGAPAWGVYPPLAYAAGFGFGPAINIGFWFDGWGSWAGWAGWESWGWWPSWYGSVVFVNEPFFTHCGFRGYPEDGHHGREPWHHRLGHGMLVPSPGGRVVLRQHAPPRAFPRTAPRSEAWRTRIAASPRLESRPLGASFPRGTTLWPGGSGRMHPWAGGGSQRWHERFEWTRPVGGAHRVAGAGDFRAFFGSHAFHISPDFTGAHGFHGSAGMHGSPGAVHGGGHRG